MTRPTPSRHNESRQGKVIPLLLSGQRQSNFYALKDFPWHVLKQEKEKSDRTLVTGWLGLSDIHSLSQSDQIIFSATDKYIFLGEQTNKTSKIHKHKLEISLLSLLAKSL